MSEIASDPVLQKEMDEVDDFIMSLSPQAAAYVEKLRACKMKFALPQHEFFAVYNVATNTMHAQAGMDLALRFNMRVHEGAHALQARSVPYITSAISDFSKTSKLALSLADFLKIRQIMEVSAHAIEAQFNALAVGKTGDLAFMTCMRDPAFGSDYLVNYVDLQIDLHKAGRTPTQIKEEVAQRYLTLEAPLSDDKKEVLGISALTQRDISDLATLSVLKGLTASAFAPRDVVGMDDMWRLLNGAGSITGADEILKTYRTPFKIAPFMHDDGARLGLAL